MNFHGFVCSVFVLVICLLGIFVCGGVFCLSPPHCYPD